MERIRENPDLYEFLSLCEQVRLQLVREDISEGDAINMIKDLGCFHKGFQQRWKYWIIFIARN